MNEANYYTQNSAVVVTGGETLPPTSWRPGDSGNTERVVFGHGQSDGWLVYFAGRMLVLESWKDGSWQFSRMLNCEKLLSVPADHTTRHACMFGYQLENNLVSLAVISHHPASGKIQHVLGQFHVPDLKNHLVHPARIHFGGVPVKVSGGEIQNRQIHAKVKPVGGRLFSNEFLTPGMIPRIAQRVVRE